MAEEIEYWRNLIENLMTLLERALLDYKELQNRIPGSQRLYDKGLDIFLTFGPKNNLRRLLSRGQANPKTKHWNHLQHQLEKLGLSRVQHSDQPVSSPEARDNISKSTFEAPIHLKLQAPESLSDDLDVLVAQNRQLAQNRAILANKLSPVEMGGNIVRINKNIDLVEEILEIVAQQQPIEEKIEALKKDAKPEEKDENPIIYEDKTIGPCRLNQLYEMTISELGALKKRLVVKRNHLEKRIPAYKKPSSKLKGEKQLKMVHHAVAVIERVIADIKIANNA